MTSFIDKPIGRNTNKNGWKRIEQQSFIGWKLTLVSSRTQTLLIFACTIKTKAWPRKIHKNIVPIDVSPQETATSMKICKSPKIAKKKAKNEV